MYTDIKNAFNKQSAYFYNCIYIILYAWYITATHKIKIANCYFILINLNSEVDIIIVQSLEKHFQTVSVWVHSNIYIYNIYTRGRIKMIS